MKGNNPLFGRPKRPPLPKELSRSQEKRIESGYRKIDDHLQKKDIEGAIEDLRGFPIKKKGGGDFQHLKEVADAMAGLEKETRSLRKSLKNPNLTTEAKKAICQAIKEFEKYIEEWGNIKEKFHE